MRYSTISIIARSNDVSNRINEILHEYSDIVIGRIGIPKPEDSIYIITVVLKENGKSRVDELFERIKLLKEVKANILSLDV